MDNLFNNIFNEIVTLQAHEAISPYVWALMLSLKYDYRYYYKWHTKPGTCLNESALKMSSSDILISYKHASTREIVYKVQNQHIFVYVEICKDEVRDLIIHGDSSEQVDEYYKYLVSCETPVPIFADKTVVRFWHYEQGEGANYYTNKLGTPDWQHTVGNYSNKQRSALESLLNYQAEDTESGKIILLRGIPGSGKSFYIRTLMQTWKKWCSFNYIIDVNKLFEHTSYMLEVFRTQDNFQEDEEDDYTPSPQNKSKHNLIILEDCGELIARDAKALTGQSLSKLLNLADGILGQGTKCLILISTNEELSSLHPAVTRPGRCLANIDFPPLSPEEAKQWQLDHEISNPVLGKSMSVAELYELAQEPIIDGTVKQKTIGFKS